MRLTPVSKTAVLFITCFSLAACGSTGVISSIGGNSDDPTIVDTFALTKEDFNFAAEKAVNEFLASPASTRADGTRWRVSIGEVVNETTFQIDTRSMTSRMRSKLINSGKFSFSGFTGQDRTSFVADARQLSKSRMVDKRSVVKQGTVQAPNMEIIGEIRQRIAQSGNRRRQRVEFEFDFYAVDAETGQVVFTTIIDDITKSGSNRDFVW